MNAKGIDETTEFDRHSDFVSTTIYLIYILVFHVAHFLFLIHFVFHVHLL